MSTSHLAEIMKSTIKYCLVLGVGVFIGFIAALAPASIRAGKQTNKLWFNKVFDDATIAIEIQAGKQANVQARLSRQFPKQILLAEKLDRGSMWCTNALWMIKAYYQIGDTKAPADIAAALEKLPAEPPAICRNKLREVFGGQIPKVK